MGTNVSPNLFSSAPPNAAGKAITKTSGDMRRSPAGQSDKAFSKELKNATADDKPAEAVVAEAQAQTADSPVTAKADTEANAANAVEEKNTVPADEIVAAKEVPEVEADDPENLVTSQAVAGVTLTPMAELSTYFQPVEQKTDAAVNTGEFVPPVAEETTAVQQILPLGNENIVQMEPITVPKQTVLPEDGAIQQPVLPESSNNVVQAAASTNVIVQMDQQPKSGVNSQPTAQQALEVEPVMQEDTAVANSVLPENVETKPQPKSIEALLRPVQPTQKAESTGENQMVAQVTMTNEQQMLAVLSGRRIINQQAPVSDNSQAPKTTVEDMNTLLGQTTQMVNGSEARRGFNPDGQQPQQSFQQNMEADIVAPQSQAQPTEADKPAFAERMEAAQTVNASTVAQPQTADSAAQTSTQQNVSQTRTDYQINQQIVEQARLLRNAENTEMVIKLNPRHLGDLTLRVSVNSNGGVTATFHTDNAQVRAILETSMIQLQKDLNEQGIKVDSVEVQTGLSDGQLPEGQSQGYYQQQEQQNIRSQRLDLKDFEDDVDSLATEPVNSSTGVIRDSEGNKISDGVDYAV
jgi:flagellar hook-length control protein FliK